MVVRSLLVLWPEPNAYLVACLEQAVADGVAVRLVCGPPSAIAPYDAAQVSRLVDVVLTDAHLTLSDDATGGSWDAVLIAGWHIPPFRRFAAQAAGKSIRVLHFDNQWRATPRQRMACLLSRVLRSRYFDVAFVPGQRQREFAVRLGFPGSRIALGSYACDSATFLRPEGSIRTADRDRRGFVFVGRLVPEKGIHELLSSYALYRERVPDPWPLLLCGNGPLKDLAHGQPGVTVTAFVQPVELAEILSSSAVFVLPSRFEPWGVALHEAATAGLAIVTTDAVGSADAFVKPHANGVVVAVGDIDGLTEALVSVSQSPTLVQMLETSRTLGANHTPRAWCDRLYELTASTC